MITYVDTSTLIKLVIDEDGSDRAGVIWVSADSVVAVSLIVVEAKAALAAARRGGRLTAVHYADASAELDAMLASLHLVDVTERVIAEAVDLAEAEALRGYDAVHLAAALLVGATVFSSADSDLCTAAARRGLHVANPLDAI